MKKACRRFILNIKLDQEKFWDHTFAAVCVCWISYTVAIRPVSYTHLDVYKRQSPLAAIISFQISGLTVLFCLKLNCVVCRERLALRSSPLINDYFYQLNQPYSFFSFFLKCKGCIIGGEETKSRSYRYKNSRNVYV